MENNLTYIQSGDYLIPDLRLSEQPQKPLGKYGRMRKAYLKEHRPILYNQLLMSEKLYPHLIEIDETADSRLEQMMPQLSLSTADLRPVPLRSGTNPENRPSRECENALCFFYVRTRCAGGTCAPGADPGRH